MILSNDYINKIIKITIDRPLGSKHPKFNLIYPINYGYVKGVKSGDNEDLDAYVLGINKPLTEFTGKCIAIIHRLDDDDDKLVLTPENIDFSNEQIRELTNFQEKYFKSEIIR